MEGEGRWVCPLQEGYHIGDSSTTLTEGWCTSPCASLCVLLCCVPRLSTLQHYYIPKDGPLQSYKDHIQQLPAMDCPEAFRQHPMLTCSQIRGTGTYAPCGHMTVM